MIHPELVHRFAPVVAADGKTYEPRVYAARGDITWEGWLVFLPEGGGTVMVTERETTQPDLDAVRYWATGLEPVYVEGAFARAHPLGRGRRAPSEQRLGRS